jgi:hypothetical protein
MHEPQDDGPLRLTIVLSALLTGLLVLAGYG